METIEVEAEKEFPRYQSHKRVHALKLSGVNPSPVAANHTRFIPNDPGYHPIEYPNQSEVVKRCMAQQTGDPGYLVVYADGFTSWSPTKAFEDGYTAQCAEEDPS